MTSEMKVLRLMKSLSGTGGCGNIYQDKEHRRRVVLGNGEWDVKRGKDNEFS